MAGFSQVNFARSDVRIIECFSPRIGALSGPVLGVFASLFTFTDLGFSELVRVCKSVFILYIAVTHFRSELHLLYFVKCSQHLSTQQ